jgi:hypothetical protein
MPKDSKSKRAVEIAKDVLKQLKIKKYIATQGTYVSLVGVDNDDVNLDGKQLDEILKDRKVKCRVCAKGALLMSKAMVYDDLTFGEKDDVGSLREDFDADDLNLMEAIFEGDEQFGYDSCGNDTAVICEINKAYRTPEKVLEVLMKNVIKNKGRLKVSVEVKLKV